MASVGNIDLFGFEKTLPPPLVHAMWKLREKLISKEVHKKLHPLV